MTEEDYAKILNGTILEDFDDNILKKAKHICFSHLDDPKNILKFTDGELIECYEFVYVKFTELKEIREELNLSKHTFPLVEIDKLMEEYTSSDSLFHSQDETLIVRLTRELNNTLEQLSFCYGILRKLVQKREIFKH